MEDKYPHLNELMDGLLRLAIRFKKEYSKEMSILEIYNKFKNYLNTLTLNDNVYEDIINMICNKENNLTYDEFLTDIYKGTSRKYLSNSTIGEIIAHLRNRTTNFNLLLTPLLSLFNWSASRKGHEFYASLNMKIGYSLRLNKILNDVFR